jgi:hypothetical protein
MNDLISEVARFRHWAAAYTPDWGPEWECDYENWHDLYDVVLRFVNERPFASWTDVEIHALLYALARDNELQHIAEYILSCNVVTLIAITRAAVEIGEPDAKWQLAEELGHLEQAGAEAEQLLITLGSVC